MLAAWPPAQPPRPWTVLPGWAYVADGLSVSLAAVLLLSAGTALATRPLTGSAAGGRVRAGAGWALLLLALGQAVFAAGLGGRWLGLEIAGPALWLLAPGTPRPLTLLRHLAGYPLLAVALSGLLDATPAPGQVIPAVPAWVVIALLVSALVRAATFLPLPPFQNPTSKLQHPTPSHPQSLLYAAVACYPLVRSLAAGPWDTWGRFAVVAAGLILLGGTVVYCLLRFAYPHAPPTPTSFLNPQPSFLIPLSSSARCCWGWGRGARRG
jgi:hypothetical protein